MIELTVKTLDSQNHAFSVDDDMTVSQFKERIAEVINIPVDSQRLIYCGRVLQDSKKLQEYDVNGKVVHLVQRAPPSTTRRSRSPQPTPNTTRRQFTGPMYWGSMAFPSGIVETSLPPPPPTQSLSASRLNVARRMLRRAENILTALEDPQSTRARESPSEEPQDDVTPVFAAQVFVPNPASDDALAAAVSAVQNGILQQEQQQTASQSGSSTTDTTASTEPIQEAPPTVGATTANGQSAQNNAQQRLSENSSGTIEMARLLDDLNKVQERLRPFMEHYHAFMREDPTIETDQAEAEGARYNQTLINRVSEIMHLLGHAYHSLSDVMVQVSTPPPRPLLCRPILIQHSAVLQAGIPIQVEAQINLAPDRRSQENNTERSTTAVPSDAPTATTDTNNTSATPSAPPADAPRQPTITASQIRPNVHEIRIDSFPFDLRNLSRQPMFHMSRSQTQNNNTVPPSAAPPATENSTPAANETPVGGEQNRAQPNAQHPPGQPRQGEPNVVVMPSMFMNNMNPNMEFFMEVTPESITIDSLETTVVTAASQAENVLRGTFGAAPPEFIQSILQAVAGQMMGSNAQPNQGNAQQPPTSTESTETTEAQPQEQTTASSVTQATGASATNVNSQARGNTQTHPTTATQTRSTARPHVHLAQHTMQGFDPFLPCNSHHIRRRRNAQAPQNIPNVQTNTNNNTTGSENDTQNNNQAPNSLYGILQGILRSIGNNVNRMTRERTTQPETASSTTGTNAAPPTTTSDGLTASTAQNPPDPLPPFSTFLSQNMLSTITDGSNAHAVTIASLLENFPDHTYVEGEGLFSDLIMTLARLLTFGDIMALNNGSLFPLMRIRPALRTFFRNRVLQGECPTQRAIARGATRLIEELQPILGTMNTMRVRDDIDIVESANQLCRIRFPSIISLVMSRMTGTLQGLVDQIVLTLRHMSALALHSCLDGQSGVEELFRTLIARYTGGYSPSIQQLTINNIINQFRQILTTLDVPLPSIQPYIIIKSAARGTTETITSAPEPEAMECEEAPIVESVPEPPPDIATSNSAPTLDVEPLPNVVIGAEPWHRVLSADWIPIITRDTQRQRRQSVQQPFSDAYLSGMPSKRRKIVTSGKPQGSLSQVISDGVRRAVTATGVTSVVPLETVVQAASADISLQAAYREVLRTRVQASLRENPDFNPERFPNASNYFNVK